jgi:Tol biopolymer transport system component
MNESEGRGGRSAEDSAVDDMLRDIAGAPARSLHPTALLAPGTRVGPYEVRERIGAGGMGVVYRADDTRLRRPVAIKVLSPEVRSDPRGVERLGAEARAAGALHHPNVLVVYDVGEHEGSPYVVSELLEGTTLRERLGEGALPLRKALDVGAQIARGLAAAHEHGIVHRDLKPENLFLTREGTVKILDFGLAKVLGLGEEDPTALHTQAGTVMGTIGYMSPEQVRGQPVDGRSDLFSLGAVLYEMLIGRRAFRRESAADTLGAILQDDPLSAPDVPRVSEGVERVLRRCLEKDPADRFQSTRDVAFELEDLTGAFAPRSVRRRRGRVVVALLSVSGAALVAGAFFAGRASTPAPVLPSAAPAGLAPATYRQITFRRGTVSSARFAPDGRSVLYSARWEGERSRIYRVRPDTDESQVLGVEAETVLSVSRGGEVAVSLRSHDRIEYTELDVGVVPLAGGTPREVARGVLGAAWMADGQLAVIRPAEGGKQLEAPPGKVLYQSRQLLFVPRVSPAGNEIAVLEIPRTWGATASLLLVDLAGQRRVIATGLRMHNGLGWSPGGDALWVVVAEGAHRQGLYEVARDGHRRLLARPPGVFHLYDIARDGRALLGRQIRTVHTVCRAPGAREERAMSWTHAALVDDLSPDGRRVVLTEYLPEAEAEPSALVRNTDGSPPTRLGSGSPHTFSPDGKWVVAFHRGKNNRLVLLPTGPGEARLLDPGRLAAMFHPSWAPDGRRLYFSGREPGHELRTYAQDVKSGPPRPLLPEGVRVVGGAVSPDGKWLLGRKGTNPQALYPSSGQGAARPLRLPAGRYACGWGVGGQSLFLAPTSEDFPFAIERYEIESGRVSMVVPRIGPADPTGTMRANLLLVTPKGDAYCYSYFRDQHDLFIAEGLK